MSIFVRLREIAGWIISFFVVDRSRVNLNGRRLKIIKQIGEGGFSFVYLAKPDGSSVEADPESGNSLQNKSGSNLLAIKKLRIQIDEQKMMFHHEVAMHKKIGRHPNVLELLDSCIQEDSSNSISFGYLLFPFYQQGTIQDLLMMQQAIGEFISLSDIVKFSKGISQGLMAFHSKNPQLAFRDLKPANILIDASGNAVLMDLGSVDLARVTVGNRKQALELQEKCAETCTAPYRAPELFDIASNTTFDERTDVWSLGCTIYAMAFYTSPFDGSATSAMSGKIHIPDQTKYPTELFDLIRTTLQVDASKRPFVPEVIQMIAAMQNQ